MTGRSGRGEQQAAVFVGCGDAHVDLVPLEGARARGAACDAGSAWPRAVAAMPSIARAGSAARPTTTSPDTSGSARRTEPEASIACSIGQWRGQRFEEGVEDVPGAAERDRPQLVREESGGAAEPRVGGQRALVGDRLLEIGQRQDAVADERLLAGLVDQAEVAEAPEQKRKGGQPSDWYCRRCYLLKSMEMVAGALPVMVDG